MSDVRRAGPIHGTGTFMLLEIVAPPAIAVAMLLLLSRLLGVRWTESYSVMSALTALVSLIVFREIGRSPPYAQRPHNFFNRTLVAWSVVIGCLAALIFGLKISESLSRRFLMTWTVVTPALIAAAQYGIYLTFVRRTAEARVAVIAGISDFSRRLAKAITEQTSLGLTLAGWFEDRSQERSGPVTAAKRLGLLSDLPGYVRTHNIDVIYIALPIRHEERTKKLLDELHDTTASIYFVPDIFVFDLIQSRVDVIDGIPVVALCETPFVGLNGLVKRYFDLTVSTLLLILLAPVLLLIALGVAVTTPGSVIFKQRRYGLDGREIVVYKFRSMSTSDDDNVVRQATRDDDRITPFGRFIRKYSLDELPQLFNVFQGTMSLVGPRPHAVAHNEMYRHLIKGYMIRHKVPPGITGLAQIRGYRGETAEVADMRARVEADLEYVRRWSLALDIKILWKTAWQIFGDAKAY